MTAEDHAAIRREFKQAVNMSPAALRKWLETEDSKSVGMHPGGGRVTDAEHGESVGHHMGERILALHATAVGALSEDDYADMRKVLGYVHRHMAQRPAGDVTETRWRKSLMNWGHDPLK